MTSGITRRCFLRLLAGLPLLTGSAFFLPATSAQTPANGQTIPKVPIGRAFAGEELYYDIAFWLLGRVAIVKMTFAPGAEKSRYVCTLQGETVGLTGFVTRYRTDTYRAVMEEVAGGGRLRSLSFEEQIRIGKRSRRLTHTFDHKNRKWIERNVRMSGATSEIEHDIPGDQDYNDFLTAAYNFRYGVYGAVERGKTYRVPVFPKRGGVTAYEVKIASAAEEGRLRDRGSVRDDSEYRIELAVDPEVVQSERGLIKGWLAKGLYPVDGVIEDVFLFGDVRGTLARRVRGEMDT
jgi:hypothetical protein